MRINGNERWPCLIKARMPQPGSKWAEDMLKEESKVYVRFFGPGPDEREGAWVSTREVSGWEKYKIMDVLNGKGETKRVWIWIISTRPLPFNTLAAALAPSLLQTQRRNSPLPPPPNPPKIFRRIRFPRIPPLALPRLPLRLPPLPPLPRKPRRRRTHQWKQILRRNETNTPTYRHFKTTPTPSTPNPQIIRSPFNRLQRITLHFNPFLWCIGSPHLPNWFRFIKIPLPPNDLRSTFSHKTLFNPHRSRHNL